MSTQQIIGLNDVVEKLPLLINSWCEQQCILQNKQEHQMCKIAVDTFGHVFSKDHIRKHIEPKYKIKYRAVNGCKSWLGRVAEKTVEIDEGLKSSFIEGTKFIKN